MLRNICLAALLILIALFVSGSGRAATPSSEVAMAPALTVTPAATAAPVASETPAQVAAAVATPLPTFTATPIPTPSPVPSDTPTWTPTVAPSPTPSSTPTATPAVKPAPTGAKAPARKPTVAATPVPKRPALTGLHTDGPYILTGAGTRVLLKGVSINTFNNGNQNFADARHYLDIAIAWHANLVRFQLDVSRYQVNELSQAIDYATSHGMYVILTPTGDNGKDFPGPTQASHDSVLRLAQQFKCNPAVLLGLINEVNDRGDDGWYTDLQATAKDLRAICPRTVIVMSGRMWNRDFSIVTRIPWPYNNTIFDVHYYAYLGKGGKDNTDGVTHFDNLIGHYPVLIGESGMPGDQGGRNNPLDAVYAGKAIALVKSNPFMVHWAAYEMAPADWQTSLLLWDGSPSARGRLFYDDLNAAPPTRFLATSQ
jgi:hypothetical protein